MAFTPATEQPYFNALNPQPPSTGQNLIGTLGSEVGATTAQGKFQYGLLGQDLSLANTGLQNANTYNNVMAGYQQGQLGISAQQQGIQRLGLQQQGAQQQAQQGFEQQQFALSQTQFPEQRAEAALNYQNAMKNLTDSGAAAGTSTTQGQQRAIGTEQQQYQWQQQDINRAQTQSQIQQQAEQSGFGYSQQQLANASANLDLLGKANGMSQDQVLTMLNYGQQQAGQQAGQDVLGILSQMGQTGVANQQQLEASLSQAGFQAGINALPGK